MKELNLELQKKLLLEQLKNKDYCPHHRNCDTCTYRQNDCKLIALANRLVNDGWRKKIVCVEIDIDGVAGNLIGNDDIKKRLSGVLPTYSEDIISTYDMSDLKRLNPIAYQIIRDSWGDADFVGNIPLYDGVLDAFQTLVSYSNLEINIHAMVSTSEEVRAARMEWIQEKLIRPVQKHIKANINCIVDFGEKKMLPNMDFVIEDCIENLHNSNATHKLLVSKSYNRDVGVMRSRMYLVENFADAVQYIVERLSWDGIKL